MRKLCNLLCAALLLAACAQQPAKSPVAETQPAAPAAKQAAQATPKLAAEAPQPLPNLDLDRKLLYQFLVAEMAINRGDYQLAARIYLDLARATHDPRVARRATDVAFYSRQYAIALEAATLWLQADPNSVQARQTLAVMFVNSSRLEDARPHLEIWLSADPQNIGASFLQLNGILARHSDKAGVLALMQELAKPYPNVPEAHLAVAQAAVGANDADAALAETRQALHLKPDWEMAALFQAQLLARKSNQQALDYLRDYVKRYPKAKDARLNYARLLVSEKKYSEARAEFQTLTREFPDNVDVATAVGLLSMQLNDYDAAEAQLKRVLELEPKNPDTVRLYLGQVNEERKRYDEAIDWYRSVGAGDQYITAQTRIAQTMAKQGKLAEARAYLRQVETQDPQQRVQLTQAEAQILRESNEYKEAFDLLGQALDKDPNAPDLLYDYAMAAEKIDRIDVLEANLRKLIRIKPDHAHAYNALGYTLADRTDRLEEAQDLIETALKLAPDDPFIMDSMGWVLYRRGNLNGGYDYLARAYKARPDPEIAAHLGEVLWKQGRRDEAEKVWRTALKDNPSNEVLQATFKKFLTGAR